MKKMLAICFSAILMLSISGCAGMSNQDVGVLSGGAIGGALGSLFGSGSGKILAAVGGTVVGALIGGSIGKSMDRQDRMRLNHAVASGRDTHWRNPDNGNEYWVEPTPAYSRDYRNYHTYRDDHDDRGYRRGRRYRRYRGDEPCRDYTTRAIIGGKKETIYGRACRKADGTWKVVR